MKRGMKTFSRAIPEQDVDQTEKMFEKIVQGNMDDGLWEGYERALKGVLEALGSENDLRVVSQIAEDKFSLDKLEKIRDEMEERASQRFRPPDERGYYAAWDDILSVLIEDQKENS